MLKSKSILAEKSPNDGTRISIMSRHTLNDGVTPDPRLTPDRYDEHRPILAAPAKAVGGYYRGELSFDDYANVYREHLRKNVEEVIKLIEETRKQTVTVLCIEDTPELCHRRLLIEFSKELAEILGSKTKTQVM